VAMKSFWVLGSMSSLSADCTCCSETDMVDL
jgi:hypothetical protein